MDNQQYRLLCTLIQKVSVLSKSTSVEAQVHAIELTHLLHNYGITDETIAVMQLVLNRSTF